MGQQIMRRAWNAMSLQIVRRPDHEPANIGGEALRDHVLRNRPTIANAGVEAAVDHVDHPIADRDFDLDVRIALQELGHDGSHEVYGRFSGDVDADPSHRRVTEAVDDIQALADLVERLLDRLPQRFAGGRQRDAAACAIEQSDAQALFQTAQRMAQGRGADPQLQARPAETAMPGDLEKGREISQVRTA